MLAPVAAALLVIQDPWPHELTWDAPEGSCPDQSGVKALVDGYLGEEAGAKANVVRAAGRVTEEADGWKLELTVEAGEGRGETTLTGTDCEVLARAAALKMAMAIDPLAVLARMEAEAEPAPEPEPEPEPERVAPSPPTPAADHQAPPAATGARRPLAALVRVSGGVGAGVVPGLGGSVGGAVGLHGGTFRLELEARHWFASDAVAPDRGSVAVSLTAGTISGCAAPTLAHGRLEIPLCVGLGAGAMVGRGQGVPVSRRSRQLWIGLEAGSGLVGWVHRRVGLRVSVAAAVPLIRPGFALDSQGTVHRAPSAGARAGLGIELRFP